VQIQSFFDPDSWFNLFKRSQIHSRIWLIRLALIVFGVVLLLSIYFQVEPDEVGIVRQFGKYSRTVSPGPHFKWPFGIESVTKVPVQRQLKEEFGYRTLQAGIRSEYTRDQDSNAESAMLTGDLNVANVEWIVQYKIKNPYSYVFRVRNVRETFRDLSEASMRQVVGDHNVTEVLTVGREEVQIKAKLHLQHLCDRYQTGIQVLQLVLQDVNPPAPVRASFNEVNQSMQERERSINQAWARYNQVIPEAGGKALQEIESAEGYAAERVNQARGDVERFIAVEREYAKAPEVTKTRLYLETMAEVLPKSGKHIIVDSELKNVLPILQAGEVLK